MAYEPPEQLNLTDHFLAARVREGAGSRIAIRTDAGNHTYEEMLALASRFARRLVAAGVQPEHRVLIALPDGPEYVRALFGTLAVGAVVVMANPGLSADDFRHLLEYSRARAIVTHRDTAAMLSGVAAESRFDPGLLVVGDPTFDAQLAGAPSHFDIFPSHRDDPAIWLFSGGTTGRPKAVVQTQRAFAYTTECYAKGVIGYRADDVTMSVPKLYFGYATGANCLFPFAVGASTVLFPEPPTAEVLFEKIRKYRPTILINVPTMIHKMLAHPDAKKQDLSSLRVCTSAGEALPAELYAKWMDTFGVDLLDGLGTAEMWHIFISNQPGRAKPGTLGTVVPGFEVEVRDEAGERLPPGETGWLWVRGGARALGYWQQMEKNERAFRGEWYVSGDLISMDADGYVTYCGRGDELLKVAGKWLAPAEVEGCLLTHPQVAECAVVGRADGNGLVKPIAYVVARERRDELGPELQAFVRERLAAYKHPRDVIFVDALPRTHLGKVDRGKLGRAEVVSP